jgi:hypothetical protein
MIGGPLSRDEQQGSPAKLGQCCAGSLHRTREVTDAEEARLQVFPGEIE